MSLTCRKRKEPCSQDWSADVFDVNQLMFTIWTCFEFPAVLRFASVDSSWKARLWPVQVLTVQEWRRASHRGKARRYLKPVVELDRDACITSRSCLFGRFVNSAVFHSLPTTRFHTKNVLQQLFATYSHIVDLSIVGPRHIKRWQLNPEGVRDLFSFWHEFSLVQDRSRLHFHFMYCNVSSRVANRLTSLPFQQLSITEDSMDSSGCFRVCPFGGISLTSLNLHFSIWSDGELIDLLQSHFEFRSAECLLVEIQELVPKQTYHRRTIRYVSKFKSVTLILNKPHNCTVEAHVRDCLIPDICILPLHEGCSCGAGWHSIGFPLDSIQIEEAFHDGARLRLSRQWCFNSAEVEVIASKKMIVEWI